MKTVIKFVAALMTLSASIWLTLYFSSATNVKQEPRSYSGRGATETRVPVDLDQDIDSLTESELAALTRAAYSAGSYQRALELAGALCQRSPDEFYYQFLRGNIAFAAGEIDESVVAFDEVVRLNPGIKPRLWQRGLALYYADRFEDAVEQFETHQTVNTQDVENAVWHLLCAGRIKKSGVGA